MNTRTRYGLIGAGSRSQMYTDAISSTYTHRAQLVAVCEPNPSRREFAASRIEAAGGGTPTLWDPDDLEVMLAAERIDRVIITARDDSHAALVVRCLDAGAPVVVEKPLTIDVPSARAIEAAVARTGGEVILTFNYRYSPRNSALRRVIRAGTDGATKRS